jgi:cell division protein FtsW (lipid II flippase)
VKKRLGTAVVFGAAAYAIAWSAGASVLWSAVAGIAAAGLAYALTDH